MSRFRWTNHRLPGRGRFDEAFNEYLYESLAVTHPVLADVATVSDLLCVAHQRLERALVYA